MRIRKAVGITWAGARGHNEDGLLRLDSIPLYAVADGDGGPGVGDVAADMALRAIEARSEDLARLNRSVAHRRSSTNRLALGELLDQVFNDAGRKIQAEAWRRGDQSMAAALLLATVVGSFAYIAHVGDCRAYLLRAGRLLRLTEDHSVAELRYRRGLISHQEYLQSPERRVLYQTLGQGMEVDVDLAEVRLSGGDVLLLCSDGLPLALPEDEIAARVDRTNLSGSSRILARAAAEAGAPDNLSLILLGVDAEVGDEPIEAVTEVMGRVFLFASLSQPERLVLAPYLEEMVFEAGEAIVTEGEAADSFFVVLSGRVRITRGSTHLTDVSAGGHFGELALTRAIRRSATVRALVQTRLFSLSRERFQEVVRHKPELGARLSLALLDNVGDRLRDLTDRIAAAERALQGRSRSR